ncbi:MAG: hypothetical protein KKD48_03495 [Nanoarchaeota archaeon]|nr:hypothetical protein [Nanoarchaeota archaeon]
MAEEKHHHKEEHKHEEKKDSFIESLKKLNFWQKISIVLAVLLIFSVFTNGFKINSGKDVIAAKVVDFVNTNILAAQGVEATIISTTEKNGLYLLKLDLNGQELDTYITKDGKLLFPSAIDLTQTQTGQTPVQQKDIPKTDKPIVKAYIYSYCPYGSQFIKAMLPVYDLLKNKADIQVVAIGAMHGEFEKIESLRQICIEKNYGKDKLWAYYNKFYANTDIGNCNGDDKCLSPLLTKVFSGLSIDSKKIDGCMLNDAPDIYNAQGAEASQNGVTGSPTFSVNDVQSQVSRIPDSIKQVVCSGFISSPSECSKTLSTQSPSAGFGGSTGTNSNSSC